MKVVYGLGNLPRKRRSCVATVGVFDGVHRGHRKILERCVRQARRRHLASVVVTFEMHPSHTLERKHLRVPLLLSLPQRLALIAASGVDVCYVLRFDRKLSGMSPRDFVTNVLMKKIGMVSLYVGEDFVFGRKAQGNIAFLKQLSKKLSFRLSVTRHMVLRHRVVSSTLIRALVAEGRMREAGFFLGHPFSVYGPVVSGDRRGRLLGFPTANIRPSIPMLFPDGVYASLTRIGGRFYKSLTYAGRRPTFCAEGARRNLEVFLIGLSKNLYGCVLETYLLERLRGDKKFADRQALIRQMEKDLLLAQAIF